MTNGEWTITIPQSEYDALRAVESNAMALERLARKNRYMSIDDALVILGFEPIEEEKDAGKPDAD
mgnify:FL=1